jgi:hypothetical protein
VVADGGGGAAVEEGRGGCRGGGQPAAVADGGGGATVEEGWGGRGLELQWDEAKLFMRFNWAMWGGGGWSAASFARRRQWRRDGVGHACRGRLPLL